MPSKFLISSALAAIAIGALFWANSKYGVVTGYADKPRTKKFSKVVVVITDAEDPADMKKCINGLINQTIQIDNIRTYKKDFSKECDVCKRFAKKLGDPKGKGAVAAAFDEELEADTAVIVMKCQTTCGPNFIKSLVDQWSIDQPLVTPEASCHLESQL